MSKFMVKKIEKNSKSQSGFFVKNAIISDPWASFQFICPYF